MLAADYVEREANDLRSLVEEHGESYGVKQIELAELILRLVARALRDAEREAA